MLAKILNILVLSDIHFGHNRTTTGFIIDNLYSFFNTYKKILQNLDLLIIPGDIFERLLTTNSLDYNLAMEWLSNLSKYCELNNIKLRILEGTPSHDFKQISSFNTILDKLSIDIDFKYADKLSIEFIEEYNMNILYIPDEANETAAETYIEIIELMKEHNLSKVDLVVMHGQFHFHLPMFNSPVSHSEQDIMQLTDNYIVCGHIHSHSVYKNILTPGSFDRLKHNEEEKKGGLLISLNNGINEYLFLENKTAKIYKTLQYTTDTLDVVINDIQMNKFPNGSEIRIRINRETNLKDSLDLLKHKFKHINIKIEYTDTVTDEHKLIITYETDEIHITDSNIIPLIQKELINTNMKPDLEKILLEELEKVV